MNLNIGTLMFLLGIGHVYSQDANCTEYRTNLANAISDFTMCAIEHSRPITLCESCVDNYIKVTDSYHNLTTMSNALGPCINDYVNLDRLQIVDSLYRNSYELWNRAKCYECFTIENETLTHNRSVETKKFNELLESTLNCTSKYFNDSLLCTICMGPYLDLNHYYISISNINEKIGVCMDIVDLMNGTRSTWSKKCCEYRKNNEYIFLASTGGVTFLTILFYILAKLCTDMKKPEIFRQSRFAESLNNTNSH